MLNCVRAFLYACITPTRQTNPANCTSRTHIFRLALVHNARTHARTHTRACARDFTSAANPDLSTNLPFVSFTRIQLGNDAKISIHQSNMHYTARQCKHTQTSKTRVRHTVIEIERSKDKRFSHFLENSKGWSFRRALSRKRPTTWKSVVPSVCRYRIDASICGTSEEFNSGETR